MKMITRKTAVTVVPKGKPIFSIAGYVVEIRANSAGEYLAITANGSLMHLLSPHGWQAKLWYT